MRYSWRSTAAFCIAIAVGFTGSAGLSDPATPTSEQVARYGTWSVVRKPATFIIADTGARGRYFLCSAALFASNASLEFEAKNDTAWSVYVAAQGWDYRTAFEGLTLTSAAREIRFAQALYGGSMISAASHYAGGGKPVSIERLKALMAQNAPISVHDSKGRILVTFPNSAGDLSRAFDHAIKCSQASVR